MQVAALIIALLALVMATASLTVQIVLYLQQKAQQKQADIQFAEWGEQIPATASSDVAPFENDPTKSLAAGSKTVDDHFNEAFASSDADFTGIDDSFGV